MTSPDVSKSMDARKRKRPCAGFVLFAAAVTVLPSASGFYLPHQHHQARPQHYVSTPTLVDPYQNSNSNSNNNQEYQYQYHTTTTKSSFTALGAVKSKSKSTETVPTPLKPKSRTSKKRRDEAMKAMQRTEVETALDRVDTAQMLELLQSDEFLYPPSSTSSNTIADAPTRPRGRPDFVPGAMKYDTMVKFQEQQGIMDLHRLPTQVTNENRSTKARNGKSSVKGASRSAYDLSTIELPESEDDSRSTKTKPRKQVVKNLPKGRKAVGKTSTKNNGVDAYNANSKAKSKNTELNKYYKTDLLSADEEYNLGVKVQLMVKCEQVHEGLCLHLLRLPTIEEWAQACG